MLGSRRVVIIGVVVVSLIAVGALATLLSGGTRDQHRKVCDNLLEHIVKVDHEKSYELLSESLKASDNKEVWRSKVIGLQNVVEKGEITFIARNLRPNADGEPKETSREELRYIITNPAAINDVSCYVVDSGETVLVDGFISKVR